MRYGDKPQRLNESFLKRKDPKMMSLDELEDYIKQNKAKLQLDESQPGFDQMYISKTNETPFPPLQDNDKDLYIKELEIKVEELLKQNEELKTNFIQLSELLQKERTDYGNRYQHSLAQATQKYIDDNNSLIKEVDDLKLKNTIQLTSMSLLSSEKERHLEQNAIDKEYYESQITKLLEENKSIKREIKDHVEDFSNVIEEQKDLIEADYKEQIKLLKDVIAKNEKEKKDITKKHEAKVREMTVKINRLERNDPLAKSKSRSKGKLSELITSYRANKSKSKGKVKQLRISQNENVDLNEVSMRMGTMECNYKNSNMAPIYSGQSLTSINDKIFSLERSIVDLNRNYAQLKEKLKLSSCQEESAALKRNISIVKEDIDKQSKQLQSYKTKQQEFLKNGYVIETI